MSTTFGCLTSAATRASSSSISTKSRWLARFAWTSLTTTSFSKPAGPRCSASCTSAIPPWPIWVMSSYRPNLVDGRAPGSPDADTKTVYPNSVYAALGEAQSSDVGMPLTIRVVPHPLLDLGAFLARLHAQPRAPEPIAPVFEDRVKNSVRDLLRHGGFKPSGRSKPASEYLVTAHAENRWPRINPLVDICNVVSLQSVLPISLVDADKVTGDL